LCDVIEAINTASEQSGLGIAASYHSSGNKLQIVNTADGAGSITISDVQGELAHSLGIDAGGSRITSNNLQRRYVSENTRLQDLNMGQGVSLGKIKITDSRGVSATIDLASERAETLQDVIDAIRGATALQLEVRINDTGDGLLITDTSDGTGKLIIEDDTGTAARDLNIAGESEGAAKQIDGSFELKIDTATADTLDQVLAQINKTRLANAAIINDGSGVAPYRLSITSAASGRAGELIIDAGTTGLDLTTLTQAQDAAITLGSDDNGLLIRSTTNTITDAIPGVTLTLTGTDDQPVTVTVERDLDGMLSTLKGLVDDYNGLLDRIKQYASYDSETQTKGILFGESTLDAVKQRLSRALTGTISGAGGRFSRLSQLGVKVESGGRLSFDEQKFREAYAADSNGVTQLFTAAKAGVAVKVKAELDQLTGTGGLLDRRSKMYTEQKEALGKRVDDLNELLELKRQKLLRSFQRMEDALAQMQSQQTSISSLGSLISSFSTTKN
jgi:flagellar hook-associated protein 2